MNWNKGNSTFMHRIDTIHHIITEHKPDIFCIQEANLKSSDDIKLAQIPGYYLEVDQLLETKKLARTVSYISHQIRYKRLKYLESKVEPVIWIEVQKNGGKKKLRIQNYYRQWQELTDQGAIPDTKSLNKQTIRFQEIINVWSDQIQDQNIEVISLSDTNINLDLNFSVPSELEFHDRKITPLYRILNSQIFNKGASVVKTKPTKIHYNKNNTNIDHLITTCPNKIIQPQIIKSGYSDHMITKFIRTSKNLIHHPRFRNMRKFAAVNWSQVKAEILNYSRLETTETSTQPQVTSENLINIIEENVSKQAPIKRVQTNLKTPSFISTETKEVLKQRDTALKNLKNNKNDQDEIRLYKTLKNRVHKLISQDKKNQ